MQDLEKILWMMDWDETEHEDSGWGTTVRPDGISLHLCTEDAEEYAKKYTNEGGTLEYDAEGKPVPVYVDSKLYEKVAKESLGYRLFKMGEFNDSIIRLAEAYARYYHKDQKRKDNKTSYIAHPKSVVEKLMDYGVFDYKVLAAAWLHDTVEDTGLTIGQIQAIFGKQIAKYVSTLTKDNDYKAYMKRIISAPKEVKMIKLCDALDNLSEVSHLAKEEIQKNLYRAKDYFLPIAQDICPKMAVQFSYYIGKLEALSEAK